MLCARWARRSLRQPGRAAKRGTYAALPPHLSLKLTPPITARSDPTKLEPQPPEFGQKRQLAVHARENLIFEVRMRRVKKRGG